MKKKAKPRKYIWRGLFLFLAVPLWAQAPPFEAQDVFLALVKAYPDVVKIVPSRYNKRPYPAILVRWRLFYWVQGRILPAEEIDNWQNYAKEDFYFYPREIPQPETYTTEWLDYLETTADEIVRKKPRLYSHGEVWNTLYESFTRKETQERIKAGRFLKRFAVLHERVWPSLQAAEEEIMERAKTDPELDHFLTERMNTVYSFYWRTIANTKKRSTHSYGLSFDTVDTRNRKGATYWMWRRIGGIAWAREPVSARWMPPLSMVEILEKYGFAWGGKWSFYDTIHFEYRPDILILNGYDVIVPQRAS